MAQSRVELRNKGLKRLGIALVVIAVVIYVFPK
jgi:hypothetical protein